MKKLVYLVLMLLASCGAKKTSINRESIVKDSVAEITVKTEKIERIDKAKIINILTELENEEIIITPMDTSKSVIINGKVFKNAHISIKKNKSSKNYTNTSKVSETKLIDSLYTSIVKEKQVVVSKAKLIDKKEPIAFNIVSYIILLLLLITIIVVIRKALSYKI